MGLKLSIFMLGLASCGQPDTHKNFDPVERPEGRTQGEGDSTEYSGDDVTSCTPDSTETECAERRAEKSNPNTQSDDSTAQPVSTPSPAAEPNQSPTPETTPTVVPTPVKTPKIPDETDGNGSTPDIVFAVVPKNGKYPWPNDWNKIIANSIDKYSPALLDDNFVPITEIATICPKFKGAPVAEKKAFWALMFASMAKYESGFNPKLRYLESWGVYSEGLLQLSYGDEKGHKKCTINKDAQNIFDPAVNLQCGVVIMENQFKAKKGLFPTPKPYYWSVLTSDTKLKVKAHFLALASQIPACVKK